MLKLMYITNREDIACIAEKSGVDRIFVDLEYIGKEARQAGKDTVKSKHTLDDVQRIKAVLTKAELLVRCNPMHDESESYSSSKDEIDRIIANGADIIMLPYFKTLKEVKTFIDLVRYRTKTMLLIETPEAVDILDELLSVDGIDEVFVGLNDLSLGYKKKFMFELLADGTVETICVKAKSKQVPYGFGGIASLGKGMIPAEMIIKEHYRMGSGSVILSRSFCDVSKVADIVEIESLFFNGINEIRTLERECSERMEYFENNTIELKERIHRVINEK